MSKSDKIINSVNKINPSEEKLNEILDRAYDKANRNIDCSDTPKSFAKNASKRRIVPIAACFAVLLTVFTVGYTGVAEAKEYNQAVSFFTQNSLDYTGLSRREIKEVYKDITTGTFTNDKTALVINKITGGYEITQYEPSPEELSSVWAEYNTAKKAAYNIEYNEYFDTERGFDVFNSSVITKTDANGNTVWSTATDGLYINDYLLFNGYIAVYGDVPVWTSDLPSLSRVALINAENGEIIYDTKLLSGYTNENIKAVIAENNSLTVFTEVINSTSKNKKHLLVMSIDLKGNISLVADNKISTQQSVQQVEKLGDGYIAKIFYIGTAEEKLFKITSDGKLGDAFTYTSSGTEYFLQDIEEFGGRVYISAIAIPNAKNNSTSFSGRYEIEEILDKINNNGSMTISPDELTKLLKQHFTAVLLVCNSQSGVAEVFYSVKGSIASSLEVNDNGNLLWKTGSISDSYFSPYTSSFSISATCNVYAYEYNSENTLISEKLTGEVFDFRR